MAPDAAVTTSAAPLQPWAVVCPNGLPFRHYATEQQAARMAVDIDINGHYPFHGLTCGPHSVAYVGGGSDA